MKNTQQCICCKFSLKWKKHIPSNSMILLEFNWSGLILKSHSQYWWSPNASKWISAQLYSLEIILHLLHFHTTSCVNGHQSDSNNEIIAWDSTYIWFRFVSCNLEATSKCPVINEWSNTTKMCLWVAIISQFTYVGTHYYLWKIEHLGK